MSTREQASTGFSRRPTGCQPGCVRLSGYLRGMFGLADSGCFNPNSVLSSGNPSWHQYGKAIDLGCNWYDGNQRARGDRCFDWVLAHREELNLQQMIWGNRIYDVSYGGVRTYSHDDHKNHIHIAIGYAASQNWNVGSGPAPQPQPAPEEDDMFGPDDEARMKTIEILLVKVSKDNDDLKNGLRKLIEAEYPGGDTSKISRSRDTIRALFPEQGDTARQSRPATILDDVKALKKQAGLDA